MQFQIEDDPACIWFCLFPKETLQAEWQTSHLLKIIKYSRKVPPPPPPPPQRSCFVSTALRVLSKGK